MELGLHEEKMFVRSDITNITTHESFQTPIFAM
mgnify:CR=1 FL=1